MRVTIFNPHLNRGAGANVHLDFCQDCWPVDEASDTPSRREVEGVVDQAGYGVSPGHPEAMELIAVNASHPDYGGGEYDCAACGARLAPRDNDPRHIDIPGPTPR